MRIARLYTDQPLHSGELVVLQPQASHYLVRVLRFRRGFALTLFNGAAEVEFEAVLERPDEDAALVRIGAARSNLRESPLRITLAQALCRGEKMDLVLQKAVELGVHALQPLLTERTEVHLDLERSQRRALHWRGVVLGACEQSGRSFVPELRPVQALADWLATLPAEPPLLALEPSGPMRLAELDAGTTALTLLVGPEGGWSERELATFAARGIRQCRLGPRVLRTESAGLAAIAALQARLGDLG